MKIGDLSRATGCTVETIRYYERVGLLPPPVRSAGNYRHYAEAALERLTFIRHCRALDMSIDEIRSLLLAGESSNCSNIDTLIDAHLEHVEQRIRELRSLQEQLRALRASCARPGKPDDCGVLRGLAEPLPAGPESSGHLASTHPHTGKKASRTGRREQPPS
jgi:Cd(II)/Pb(II)-responsive transcriptional regulator